ncbi:MAG TPA: shikimate kinase, partial [Planctomycetota bacterium]|nr:shikimate kinase [Planctomycetota bacterium]
LPPLTASPETALARIQADPTTRSRRPALTAKDPGVEIREQIQLRTPYYLKAADVVVHSENRAVPEIVDEIVRDIEGRPPEERGEPAIIS